jgi:hypothetical protein
MYQNKLMKLLIFSICKGSEVIVKFIEPVLLTNPDELI